MSNSRLSQCAIVLFSLLNPCPCHKMCIFCIFPFPLHVSWCGTPHVQVGPQLRLSGPSSLLLAAACTSRQGRSGVFQPEEEEEEGSAEAEAGESHFGSPTFSSSSVAATRQVWCILSLPACDAASRRQLGSFRSLQFILLTPVYDANSSSPCSLQITLLTPTSAAHSSSHCSLQLTLLTPANAA